MTSIDTTHHAVTTAYRSRDLAVGVVEIVVTVPTFRRPEHLIRTLESLAAQTTAKRIAVIVIENDAEGLAGARAAETMMAASDLTGMIIVAHQRGNCHAYNAGWATALAAFPDASALAVIDDDEIATPRWLEELLATAQTTGADLVGGPQIPVFDAPELDVWKRHPVFTPHYDRSGPVPILYSSGNVLIRRRVLEAMPRPFLDPAFNFVGGGDSDFYRRCRNAGFTFAWSAEAAVTETTPTRRTELSWLTARGLRNGAISTLIEKRQDASLKGRVRTIGKSLALLAASPARSALLWARTGSAIAGMYHMNVAIGRLQAEFGHVNEQYRNPEAN